ncbi:DUF4262 domain-containing protein, partial [Mycobacterium tuberculosis]
MIGPARRSTTTRRSTPRADRLAGCWCLPGAICQTPRAWWSQARRDGDDETGMRRKGAEMCWMCDHPEATAEEYLDEVYG